MKASRIIGFNSHNDNHSAHETHFETIAYDDQGLAHHIIFKKNKHPGETGQKASELEACFTATANLFSAPHRALRQDIVTDQQGNILGVASEHAAHSLIKIAQASPQEFLRMKKFPNTEELSSQDFEQWLESYQEIQPLDQQWHRKQRPIELIHSMQNMIAEHEERLNRYFKERQDLGVLSKDLDEDYLDEIAHYCNRLLRKGKDLSVEHPEKYRQDFKLLEMIFERQQLEFKCDKSLKQNISQAMDIANLGAGKGFNFLDKLPQNFFALLMEAKKNNKVDVDMDSLADVFTTAYGLEEDDLHKGNIGYYITLGENNRPKFNFFKIDHDLMFVDKLMSSRQGARFANWTYSQNDFRITARDLSGFPDLKDSGNHYWPTKKAFFSKGSKAYQSETDREAYKSLKDDPDFTQAKWQRFLKQIVLPNELIVKSLQQPLSALTNEQEKHGSTSLIQRAVSARMNELRIVLLSVPEFRQFLSNNHEKARTLILNEIEQHAKSLGCTPQEMDKYKLESELALDSVLIARALHTPTTTIHTSILTQSYRCYETSNRFSGKINTRDAEGLTPLDHAIEQYAIYTDLLKNAPEHQKPSYEKMITYYADVLGDLDRTQAKYTLVDLPQYQEIMANAQKNCSICKLPVVDSLEDFKKELETIRSLPLSTLKQDKVYAVALLEKAKLSIEDLQQLKNELASQDLHSPLKFIKELRSEIWLVKLIRGAYGRTATLDQMNTCIDKKIEQLQKQEKLGSNDIDNEALDKFMDTPDLRA